MNFISRPGLLRNLQIGFGLSLSLLIITAIASYVSITKLMDASKLVDHTDSVIIETDRALFTLRDAEAGPRGFLLTGDSTFLADYTGALERVHNIIDSIGVMTADNPRQALNVKDLRTVIDQPLLILGQIVEQKKADNIFSLQALERARGYGLQARAILERMERDEHGLLADRIVSVQKYSAYTPILIVVAALLSIVITLFFYWRVHNDYLERSAMYAELRQKDADISRRIGIIGEIADKISEGKYRTRVSDEQEDSLGELAGSLNKMAESLEYSFGLLSDKEWLQTGIAGLNEVMVGETEMQNLATNVIGFVAEYTRSKVGALYLLDNATDTLTLQGQYALRAGGNRQRIRKGEGIAGQVASKGKKMQLRDVDPGDWVVSFTLGEVRPRSIIAIPFFYEKRVTGVMELGSLEEYTPRDLEFLGSIADNIGVAVHSIETRLRLQQLLEETQAQTEELQSQHGELESLNMELETQAEKLQVSEEELKVQQEELMQTNQELEERSRALEEKNQLVLIRNLEIQRKAEELTLTTRYKSEFMANMSHELRTPLNSILLLSRLLSENGNHNLTDEQIEYARVIRNSGQGLLTLIDEILDLSRIESGKLPLEHTIVPVAEIVEDMRSLFMPIARDKNLELNFVIREGAPAQVETDKQRLEQILRNLLANAFKFTSKGSVTLMVGPSPAHSNFIELVVRDTGIGIPGDKHQLIFEAFQQADGSTRRKYGGTGLGLSISRELARLLGGEITLTSQPDEGSEFKVTIPQFKMAGDDNPADPAAGAGPLRESAGAGLPEQHSILTLSEAPAEIPDDRDRLTLGDKVLLIVEDDTLFAGLLLEFTRKKGYKGIVAVSGDAAVRMARRFLPIGILLDIQLPVRNGWEVMEELKKDPHTRLIPVHIMSSFEARSESLQKGAVDFMSKPTALENMDNVFERIEYYLNRSGRKVLIVEDNGRHAQALAYFLASNQIRMEIARTITEGMGLLKQEDVHGVILSREGGKEELETLEMVRQNSELTDIPIIVFTGMNISKAEEARLRQYADSIVVKTAHSYQRVLDEVSLFLHVVAESKEDAKAGNNGRLGGLEEVLRNKMVLIADDDVRNIFSLSKALEQHKMKVLTAMDGKEAISAAEGNPVDIVLMDMMMPEMDGFEAITRLRKMPRFRHLPIIAVTAKAMAGDREKCIQAGASDYISKPVDIDQLLSLLRIWLYEK
ncbi:MAG TPA: response regulator [Puia sp.]|jgi:signal transduction histidine kinase/DNA-binding response OmpR family regulator/CHASE3 domain sensor protein|nr:response regulator [Puia sp.]